MAAMLLILGSCSFYNFSGATIPEAHETIAVTPIEDASSNRFGTLDDDLTDLLVERFVDRTRLQLSENESEADVVLSGRITGYENEPAAVGGEERATLNRVTIQADLRYYDAAADSNLVSRSFSGSSEYDPVQDGPGGEELAAQAVLEDIADDIFSAATSNW